ncbi:MAG: tryptophan synthase subunit alpha [Rickettsiales bacterium]|nr:tryptophan synthase subunit alpha [Rickettsiales bacterium]|tara:strand:+ start:1983 stop:2792 length:810 start_codon:yes stop_codon:yes gene_type:complete
MQNRIEKKFLELEKKKEKALVCFVTSGDPDLKTSQKIINTLPKSGADIIEIGIPFSDPMADGPTIQKSSLRAIKSGINLKKTFDIVKEFRKRDNSTPIILMGYFNPIFQFGLTKFFLEGYKNGVDGLIIVDLPPEEDDLIRKHTKKFNIHNIRLLTPTTSTKRIRKISESSKGFLYYISIMGITGTKKPSIDSVKVSVNKIKKITDLPIIVGFGINDPEQISQINTFADGCVVGSAIVKLIEENLVKKKNKTTVTKKINDFLIKLKKKC